MKTQTVWWRKLTAEKPPKYGVYLAYWPPVTTPDGCSYKGNVGKAFYNAEEPDPADEYACPAWSGEYHGPAQVTHWMPLLEAPDA